MTIQKVREVIGVYRALFESRGIEKGKAGFDWYLSNHTGCALMHCHGMLEEMEKFLDEAEAATDPRVRQSKVEKTMRWLGFLQGVLWNQGVYTLGDLMNHNRKKDEAFDPKK